MVIGPDKLERLCALSQDLLSICSFEGKFIYLNDAWSTVLGWDLEEIKAKPFLDFIHPDDVASTINRFEMNLRGSPTRPAAGFMNRYQTKAGGYRMLRWTTTTDMSDKLVYSSAVDVTDTQTLIDSLNATRTMLIATARTDDLTGLLNRRGGREILEREHARVDRFDEVFSIALFDIDYFKKINDTHSHQTGDVILAAVAHTLRNESRNIDVICRWGGEEFLAILPGIDVAQARLYAERMLRAVSAAKHSIVGRVTLSAGVAEVRKGTALPEAIAKMDVMLYAAKAAGRNQVGADST